MSRFTEEELRQRAFERAAWVLRHFWEEQRDDVPRSPSVHTRLFDTLIHPKLIEMGVSKNGRGHLEHLVPCIMLRDRAFSMFWDGAAENDISAVEKEVAQMLSRFLRTAHITPAEARYLDHELKLKTTMPNDWSWETGSVMARLIAGGIELDTDS
jgi:hypothetical protein